MDAKIRDIMTPDPIGVHYDQTISETARVMRDAGVGAVLVVNGESLSGVVTDRDLVIRGMAEGAGPDSPVGPLCSAKLVGVDAGADVTEAGRLVRDNAVRRLPVIDGGQIVGIVSIGDLAVSEDGDSLLAAVRRIRIGSSSALSPSSRCSLRPSGCRCAAGSRSRPRSRPSSRARRTSSGWPR